MQIWAETLFLLIAISASINEVTNRLMRVLRNKTTIISALFDIERENYDGRSIQQYLQWFGKVLTIKNPMVLFVEHKFLDFVNQHRHQLPAKVVPCSRGDIPYASYFEKNKAVLQSKHFREKKKCISAIENNNPWYNLIVFSKFKWLNHAAKRDFFSTEQFFWMDAGLGRPGWIDWLVGKEWDPKKEKNDKLWLQYNGLLPNLDPNDYMWDNTSYFSSGCFGGSRLTVEYIEKETEKVFLEVLQNNCSINDQMALYTIYLKDRSRFHLLKNRDPNNPNNCIPVIAFLHQKLLWQVPNWLRLMVQKEI